MGREGGRRRIEIEGEIFVRLHIRRMSAENLFYFNKLTIAYKEKTTLTGFHSKAYFDGSF